MSRIVRGLFGGRSSSERILQGWNPTGFTSGGTSASVGRGNVSLTSSQGVTGTLQSIINRSGDQSVATGRLRDTVNPNFSRLTNLRSGLRAQGNAAFGRLSSAREGLSDQVAPGFGRLSEARRANLQSRLSALRDTRRRTVGNVREQLARRRLGGSSFQQSQVAEAEAEFARQEDQLRAEAGQAEAQAFIDELGLSRELLSDQERTELESLGFGRELAADEQGAFTQQTAINQELIERTFQPAIEAASRILDQFNFDTTVAANLATATSSLMNDNLTAQAEARAAQQAAGEDFLGTVLGLFLPTGT